MHFIFAFAAWIYICVQVANCKEIDSKTDLQQEESINGAAEHRAYLSAGPSNAGPFVQPSESATHEESWPIGRPDIAQIKSLNVKCEKNHMKVNIEFDRPFYGMVFSKGHYSDPKCVHLPTGTGHMIANFDIFLGACGMTSSDQSGFGTTPGVTGLFIENTIIVQYDPQVQEIWDQARRLRCTWYDFYEKAVSFRPFNVDMMEAVTANFLGDNIQCWMQIQQGKGPWASEVAGIVKIGQTMTMVLAIKDDENKFDMLVRNCVAHDGKHQPVQLVDEYGCVVRPNVMSKFQKVKNFGHTATAVSYAYFQAFKFPDSMNVHFQCVIQVCRYECPEPACDKHQVAASTNDYIPAPREPMESKPSVQHTVASTNVAPVYKSPSASLFPNNILLNRKGETLPKNDTVRSGYEIGTTGGMPRSMKLTRRKRQSHVQYTDIRTHKVIQVVAPGDVAFNLPLTDNNNTVDIYTTHMEYETNSICISTIGFTGGLVFLLLMLVLSSLVAVFLFIRIRTIAERSLKCPDNIITYENPEFFKMPSMTTFHVVGDC